jgi:hypothetical protein
MSIQGPVGHIDSAKMCYGNSQKRHILTAAAIKCREPQQNGEGEPSRGVKGMDRITLSLRRGDNGTLIGSL